jgi:outer membrane protein assembly factor BamB
MNSNHLSPESLPDAACTAFEPLLTRSLLEQEAAGELRAHARHCAHCRSRLIAYDRLDTALRQRVAQFSRSPLRVEEIVQSLQTADGAAPTTPQARLPLTAPPAPTAAPAPPRHPGGRPRRIFSWVAAIAAVLALVVATAGLFASRHPARPATSNTGRPAATQPTALPASVYGTAGALDSDTNGVIFALNAADGTLRWQYPTPQAMSFKLLVAQGVLYAGETDGSVSALDARTGQRLWSVKLPGLPAAEQVANGIVYVNTLESNGANQPGHVSLYALNAATGGQLWHFDNGGISALVDGVAYVSSSASTTQSSGTLYALNASDGSARWHFQGQGAVGVWKVADGQVYIFGNQLVGGALLPSDILYAVDAGTGAPRWSFPRQPSGAMQPLGIENGLVYLLSTIGAAPEGPFTTVYALNASDGSARWQAAVQGGAVVGASAIYAGTAAGDVAAYRANDGSLLWRNSQIPGVSADMPVIAGMEVDGAAYLMGRDRGIFALRASTGTLLWSSGAGSQIGGFASGLLITYNSLSEVPGTSDAIYGLNASTGARRWTYRPAQQLARITIP